MNRALHINRLAEDVRNIYGEEPATGRERIEELLKTRLREYPDIDRLAVIRDLITHFDPAAGKQELSDSRVMQRVFGLLLGRHVEPEDLSSTELLQRLADSLNTIFDSLNQLISVINMSFSGKREHGDQTIRQFIGIHLEGGNQTKPLEAYLGQINQAFLTTHEAFKQAAHATLAQVLVSLSPQEIADARGPGLKLGPYRKAGDYDILREKIDRIQRWFDSGRLMDDFLREFEKNCQKRRI
jgi:hypothetical protein